MSAHVVLLLAVAGVTCCGMGVARRRAAARDTHLALLLDAPSVPAVDAGSVSTSTLARIAELLGLWRADAVATGEGEARRADVVADRRARFALVAGVAAVVVSLLTREVLLGGLAAVGVVALAVVAARRAVETRRRMIEAQVPDAMLTIAAALEAGNPLRRAVQILAESGPQPLAGEMALVVAETELGTSLVDSFERMAQRVAITDLQWFARALRIQQSTGGQLAPLVRTVADVMAARARQQREARALTAEGRLSAWILGLLPVLLIMACQVTNPDYLAPMFRGWGLVVLAVCGASIVTGIAWILRMIKAEEAL